MTKAKEIIHHYTTAEVPTAKRTSPRNYTHAIIGRYNWDRYIDILYKDNVRNYGSNFEWYLRNSTSHAGQIHDRYPVTQEQIDKAVKELRGFTDKKAYVEYMILKDVEEAIHRRDITGDEDFKVLQWSQSEKNAKAGLAQYRDAYLDLKVVNTICIK